MNRAAAVSPVLAPAPGSPAERWRIVLARDRRYDGQFVYAVRSTGIYCRPSCPSRRPRATQVSFFPIPEAAERAGFRACRRCRPSDSNGADPAVVLVREVCRWLDEHPDQPARLARLATHAGTSPERVRRAFHRVLGISPKHYRDARRVARLKTELKRSPRVSPALYEAGYGSPSRVYERAAAQLGMTPAAYGRGGPGVEIDYAIVPSFLGRLLVAATPRGICRVALGDGTRDLAAALVAEFPAARVRRGGAALERWVKTILRYLDGREPHLDLPTDVRATAFQRLVWDALRKIPYGATRSYSAVARAIGKPRATRAVARACATNPVAIVVPCHRVVREDGEVGGYRWGIERKRALLKQESDAQKPR